MPRQEFLGAGPGCGCGVGWGCGVTQSYFTSEVGIQRAREGSGSVPGPELPWRLKPGAPGEQAAPSASSVPGLLASLARAGDSELCSVITALSVPVALRPLLSF